MFRHLVDSVPIAWLIRHAKERGAGLSSQEVWLNIIVWGGLFILLLIATHVFDGWRLLAKRYRATEVPAGNESFFETIYINGGRYLWVFLIINEGGVYMEVPIIFRLGRPPLFIPWTDISEVSNQNYVLWKWIVLEVGNPSIATIRLPHNIFWDSVDGRARLEQILKKIDVQTETVET